MSDSQWPRYEVFVQDKPGAPHQEVGSVHAPDLEMALLNARDVFARRPHCHNLWVVSASALFTKTRQELQTWQAPESVSRTTESYAVFAKIEKAGTYKFLFLLQASSPEQALGAALEKHQDPVPFAWWVCRATDILQSQPEDIEPMFKPALDKPFRHSSYYKVISAMRQAKREAEDGD